MMKWLILLFLLWLAWRAFGSRRRHGGPPPAASRAGEDMRACAHCGLNIPDSESLRDPAGLAYCSESHRRLGPAKQGRA